MSNGHILLARFTEEDVLAGKIVSSGSRLQQLIIRPLKHAAESVPGQRRG